VPQTSLELAFGFQRRGAKLPRAPDRALYIGGDAASCPMPSGARKIVRRTVRQNKSHARPPEEAEDVLH